MKKQLITLGLASLFASSIQAANVPEKELGLLLGGSLVDGEMTYEKGDVFNPTIGLRYAQRLGTSTNFFSDLTYADIDGNRPGVGDGTITTLRGGVEWLFSKQSRYNWFLSGGLGAINVNTDYGPDFTRPLMSLGIGQAWEVGTNDALRWEIRTDQSFGNSTLPGSALNNIQALVGYSWGVGAPADTDGDGVADRNDLCPGTPAGVKVDAKGCPLDSDGDGLTDDKDKCPTVYAKTADGCPPPPPPATVPEPIAAPAPMAAPAPTPAPEPAPAPKKLVLEGVNFANDKATLLPAAISVLDQVAQTLKEWGNVKVEVAGHTDSNNTDAYNQKLSQRRAQSVCDYLISKGVDATRLKPVGYGESQPIADNNTEEGRFKNRRVELIPQQ